MPQVERARGTAVPLRTLERVRELAFHHSFHWVSQEFDPPCVF